MADVPNNSELLHFSPRCIWLGTGSCAVESFRKKACSNGRVVVIVRTAVCCSHSVTLIALGEVHRGDVESSDAKEHGRKHGVRYGIASYAMNLQHGVVAKTNQRKKTCILNNAALKIDVEICRLLPHKKPYII